MGSYKLKRKKRKGKDDLGSKYAQKQMVRKPKSKKKRARMHHHRKGETVGRSTTRAPPEKDYGTVGNHLNMGSPIEYLSDWTRKAQTNKKLRPMFA
jgi:hypothetical protein